MNPAVPRAPSRGSIASSLERSAVPSWREKLAGSWPLWLTGGGGATLVVAVGLQRSLPSVLHPSLNLLLIALGVTGIVVGIGAFVGGHGGHVGGQVPKPAPYSGESSSRLKSRRSLGGASDRCGGRPMPDVKVAGSRENDSPVRTPAHGWDPKEEASEIAPSLLLTTERAEQPSLWSKGRLLRLSEEGRLTVYSLDDALRDLEFVDQTVHGRRTRRDVDARRISSS